MKKGLTLLATGLFATALLAPATTFADTKPAGSPETSNATVTFTEDPTKPTDPQQPIDPEGPGTGEVGDLTLDYIPSLNFGSHTNQPGTYGSTDAANKTAIQVTDKRGTGEGWHVSLKLSQFADGSKTLAGAKINFAQGTVSPAAGMAGNKAPDSTKVEVTSDGTAFVPFSAKAKDATATDGYGLGTWIDQFKNPSTDIQLNVPVAAAGTFNATMTWQVASGPSL